MNNQVLLDEIEYWEKILPTNTNPELLELSFFKIFIKFEKFVSDVFISYCIGNISHKAYCPNRKLNFIDEEHLNAIIKKENRGFVNHYESIFKLSEHIFFDNPFEIISRDAILTSEFNNMKIIRDYIAHESSHARSKYESVLLNNKAFIEPFEFLQKTRRGTAKSNYTHYIEALKNSSEYLLTGPA